MSDEVCKEFEIEIKNKKPHLRNMYLIQRLREEVLQALAGELKIIAEKN